MQLIQSMPSRALAPERMHQEGVCSCCREETCLIHVRVGTESVQWEWGIGCKATKLTDKNMQAEWACQAIISFSCIEWSYFQAVHCGSDKCLKAGKLFSRYFPLGCIQKGRLGENPEYFFHGVGWTSHAFLTLTRVITRCLIFRGHVPFLWCPSSFRLFLGWNKVNVPS